MKRPENVRCENCCYADLGPPVWVEGFGLCRGHAPIDDNDVSWPAIACTDWCGEFRSEWPE